MKNLPLLIAISLFPLTIYGYNLTAFDNFGWTKTDGGKGQPLCPSVDPFYVKCYDEVPPPFTTYQEYIAWGGSFISSCPLDFDSFILDRETVTGSCPAVFTRTYNITDSCGNIISCTSQIIVNNETSPELSCPPNLSVDSCDKILDATGLPLSYKEQLISTATYNEIGGVVTDDCDLDRFTYYDYYNGACPSTIERVFTAVGSCGYTAACLQEISINNPSITSYGCPPDTTIDACEYSSQAEIQREFDNWIANGNQNLNSECSTLVSIDSLCPPALCGSFTAVRWHIPDTCENAQTCVVVFTVIPPTAITFNQPISYTVDACDFVFQNNFTAAQAALDNAIANWVEENTLEIQLGLTGGCEPVVSNDYTNQSIDICTGGEITITWVVEDICETITTTATFAVTPPQPLTFVQPASYTIDACDFLSQNDYSSAQVALDSALDNWLIQSSAEFIANLSGGCDPMVYFDENYQYIDICSGGTTTVTWFVEDICETVAFAATFSVTPPDVLSINTPDAKIIKASDFEELSPDLAQSALNDSISAWVNANQTNFQVSGGCSPDVTNDYQNDTIDFDEGGQVVVTWTVNDLCEIVTTTASFTFVPSSNCISDSIAPLLTCPVTQEVQSVYDIEMRTGLEFSETPVEISVENFRNSGGTVYDDSGIETITYVDVTDGECQSIVSRAFTVIDSCGNASACIQIIETMSLETVTEVTICSDEFPYNWNGTDYYTAGKYTYSVTNASGCDSLISLIINRGNSSTSLTEYTICESYLPYPWNGTNYNAAGVYEFKTTNSDGCDSIATLVLTVFESSSALYEATISECELPYIWNGTDYFNEGTYVYEATNAIGCDSIVTLKLNINPQILIEASITNVDPQIGDDGAISINISGGTPPYTFDWSNNKSTQNIDGLSAGEYELQVIDQDGCTVTKTFEINSISNLTSIVCPPDTSVVGTDSIPLRFLTLDEFVDSGGDFALGCNQGELTFDLLYEFNDTLLTPDVLKRTYIVEDDCGNEDICLHQITIENTTSILNLTQVDELKCSIYPNPNEGQFNLNVSGCSDGDVITEVFDPNGLLILNDTGISFSGTLTKHLKMPNLSRGVYYVVVSNYEKRVVKSVVIN